MKKVMIFIIYDFGVPRVNILSFINDEFRLINAFSIPLTRLGMFISFENKKVY